MTEQLRALIREVPDFPKPGINFYDITTLLKNAHGLRATLDGLASRFSGQQVDQVVGIESRGFLFAPHVALHLGAGFVPVRKPGKLPSEVASEDYDLEYGQDRLEIHSDAVTEGTRVVIVDDVIATGGSAAATARLVEGLGGVIVGFGFVIELEFLGGRARLGSHPVHSLITY